jgi:predicted transcriptional regulator
MSKTSPLSVRLPEGIKQKLTVLSKAMQRNQSYLVSQAVTEYVRRNAWQVQEIEKAVREVEKNGEGIPHAQMGAWVESWGTSDELPPPDAVKLPGK